MGRRAYIGKYFFVNRTIHFWNQLPANALETVFCQSNNFRNRVRKVINKAKWRCGGNHPKIQWSEVKCGEARRGEARRGEVRWGEVRWGEVRWGEERRGEGRWDEVRWGEVRRSRLWWGCEGCVSVVKWNEGKVMVKCECISSWHYVFHYCYCIIYFFLLILMYLIVVVVVFAVVVLVFAFYALCVVCTLLLG
jgi:hypothetical protein